MDLASKSLHRYTGTRTVRLVRVAFTLILALSQDALRQPPPGPTSLPASFSNHPVGLLLVRAPTPEVDSARARQRASGSGGSGAARGGQGEQAAAAGGGWGEQAVTPPERNRGGREGKAGKRRSLASSPLRPSTTALCRDSSRRPPRAPRGPPSDSASLGSRSAPTSSRDAGGRRSSRRRGAPDAEEEGGQGRPDLGSAGASSRPASYGDGRWRR
jgi:hypothetical protein